MTDLDHLNDLPPVNRDTTPFAQRGALVDLLDACERDFGIPDVHDADDEAVGGGADGDMAVTFGLMRAARRALGFPVVEYDPSAETCS